MTFFFFCNQFSFLALTDSVSVKVVLYKRCKFCPVFFGLSTAEEASHSRGETFGDQKRHRLVCEKLLEMHRPNQILFLFFFEMRRVGLGTT